MPEPKPVAVITGASAGIGAALADVFADHGHALVLVARRAPQLKALADTIEERGHARPHVIVIDLGQPDAAARIEEELREQRPRAAIPGQQRRLRPDGPRREPRPRAAARDDRSQRPRADRAVAALCRRASTRHRGGILNVASVASFMPGPGMAVYHATKAYVLSFSEALHRELGAPGRARHRAAAPARSRPSSRHAPEFPRAIFRASWRAPPSASRRKATTD